MDSPMECSSSATASGGDSTTEHGVAADPHSNHHYLAQPQQAFPSLSPHVAGLLAMARQLVAEGKPTLALQAIVAAVKAVGGDEAVFHTLHRAQSLYQSKLQATAAADELACLFAECAIAEVQPAETIMHEVPSMPPPPSNLDKDNTSILAETGRKQIVLDSYLDGSSFVCLQCGGVVSNQRRDEHFAYWCSGRC